MPFLQFFKGDRELLRFPLNAPKVQIGRHPTNDLTLPDDQVSRFHALIESRGDGPWLVDQSRNGTYLNGKKVKTAALKDGDEIKIGAWRLLFSSQGTEGERETVVEKRSREPSSFFGMIGQSEAMKKVFGLIEKAAPSEASVLLVGETGAGKELAAKAIHDLSPRGRGLFVALNCGAISPQLIESELFGHERGAFTGALSRHTGAFEQARGGTLFLDEVGELLLELQPKLLRVLEERQFRRVGGTETLRADVRVVAATHRSLEKMVKEGKFREDLYFRLYAVPITLPPLRERAGDIPLLAEAFIEMCQSDGREIKRLSSEAIEALCEHAWKGNVRELKNVILRSLLFAPGNVLGPQDILFLREEDTPPKTTLDHAEKEAIVAALKENDWNKKKTANQLGIAKSTLFHKLKVYQLKEPG